MAVEANPRIQTLVMKNKSKFRQVFTSLQWPPGVHILPLILGIFLLKVKYSKHLIILFYKFAFIKSYNTVLNRSVYIGHWDL